LQQQLSLQQLSSPLVSCHAFFDALTCVCTLICSVFFIKHLSISTGTCSVLAAEDADAKYFQAFSTTKIMLGTKFCFVLPCERNAEN